MRTLSADVVVIGSGMGGATTALALARRGVDVLVLERGARLPREPANWSPRAVFLERRYKPSERWLDGAGGSFVPGVHYMVGGNTKVYGASLPASANATSPRSSTGRAPHPHGRSATEISSPTTPRPSGSTASTARTQPPNRRCGRRSRIQAARGVPARMRYRRRALRSWSAQRRARRRSSSRHRAGAETAWLTSARPPACGSIRLARRSGQSADGRRQRLLFVRPGMSMSGPEPSPETAAPRDRSHDSGRARGARS